MAACDKKSQIWVLSFSSFPKVEEDRQGLLQAQLADGFLSPRDKSSFQAKGGYEAIHRVGVGPAHTDR